MFVFSGVCTPLLLFSLSAPFTLEVFREIKAPCKRTQHCWPTTPNIAGCYMLRPFAHPVACCWMLLGVVAPSLKPVKRFSQQLPKFLLFRDRRSVAQQCWIRCWGHARSLRMDYKDLWVVFFPRCTAGPNIVGSCCIVCIPLPTRTQQLPTLLAQQCWELLRPFARSLRFAFTPNGSCEFVPRDPLIPCPHSLLLLTIGIVRDCFYPLIFHSEKFST